MDSNNPKIIFEDDQVLVISKPAGMVVNRAETVNQETLQDWVEDYLNIITNDKKQITNKIQNSNDKKNDKKIVFQQRSGIAHRLDKETSGVMVIGKNPESLSILMAQFKDRVTKKEYLALVHGKLIPELNVINLPLKRSPYNRHKFRVDVFGKPSITKYVVEKYVKDFTLVRLLPKTGRTHQIRVHMAHLNHALVGDELYGGRKRAEKDRLWCPRHFLHAAVLEFVHPISQKLVRFESSLPNDLERALNAVQDF